MVAQTILEQIKTLGRIEMMSWGSHAFKAIAEGMLKNDLGNHIGALGFKVSGRVFQGDVIVCLMPNDTYTIHFGTLRAGKFNPKLKSVDDVYFDMLIDIIDRVETPQKGA